MSIFIGRLNGFKAEIMDLVVALAVFEAVFLILTNLETLSTTTVKQGSVSPLFLQDSTLSASKCPNSVLLSASIGLSDISILLGIFFPVPILLGRSPLLFVILPNFLRKRNCDKFLFEE